MDFYDYLGLGHLFLGTFFTFIFGGSFQSSMIAFTFLQVTSFVLIICILYNAFFKKNTLIIPLAILLYTISNKVFLYNHYPIISTITASLNSSLSVGNSCRFLRGLILPLTIIIFTLFESAIKEHWNKRFDIKVSALIGILSGISFVYSNDYGIACFLGIIILSFYYYLLKFNKKITFFYSLETIVIAIATIFIIFFAVSHGNLREVLNVYKGSGSFQRWYFNYNKNHFLYNIDFSTYSIFQGFLILYYAIKLYIKKRSIIIKDFVPLYFNLVSFMATQEYYLLSGGYSRDIQLVIIFCTILFEIIVFINKNIKLSLIIPFLTIFCIIATCIFTYKMWPEIKSYICRKESPYYVKVLDGVNSQFYNDFIETHNYIKNNNIFSTYATAQEVFEDKFQPSGYDYIIHALGDEAREKYINSFKNHQGYVVTLYPKNYQWEQWIERANWYFYRELYKNYKPVFNNSYSVYWEKQQANNNINQKCKIKIENIDASSKKIIIETDDEISGIADLYVDADVVNRFNGIKKYMLFNPMIQVITNSELLTDTYKLNNISNNEPRVFYETNYIRPNAKEYIPVRITDGYGEIILKAEPYGTELKVNNLKNEDDIYIYIYCDV